MQLNDALGLKNELLKVLPVLLQQRGAPSPVIAVGVAPAAHGDEYRIAIRPRFPSDLHPAAALIQSRTGGDVDIRVTGPITPSSRRLTIGASTSHHLLGCTGTIGFFARRIAGGELGFVSNNHVIAAEDRGENGDVILHPGLADRGAEPDDVAARLAGDYPRLHGNGSRMVDCAFAILENGIDIDDDSLWGAATLNASPIDPAEARQVWKIGRSTGRTRGRVTAFAVDDVIVDYRVGPVRFTNQIEIESIDEKPFSTGGDSGALICTDEQRPVGLLYAGSAAGGTTNSGLTYANPITAVLRELHITLAT
jgi:hypothetical protein